MGRFQSGHSGIRAFSRRRLALLIALGCIAVLALGASMLGRRQSKDDDLQPVTVRSLAAIAFPQRAYEGRLRGVPYSPQVPAPSLSAEFYSSVSMLAEGAKKRPSASNLHALGVAHLLMGKPRRAVEMLGAALLKQTGEFELSQAIRASHDSALLNDFSVAAIGGEQSQMAIESTHRAWQLTRTAEAAWNRAVALEQIGLKNVTLAAWRDYRTFDPSSQWSSEADKRIGRLEAEIRLDGRPPSNAEVARLFGEKNGVELVAQWPNPCRAYVEDSLLPALIDAGVSSDGASIRRLFDQATQLAGALRQRGRDASLADAAVELGRALLEQPGSARARSLSAGTDAYLRGKRKYGTNDVEDATAELIRASATLHGAGSPLAEWASFYLVCCAFYDNAYDQCLLQLSSKNDAAILRAGMPALVALRHWLRGLTLSVQNRRGDSLRELERAQELFESLGERDNAASMASLVAEVREYLGDREVAAHIRRSAISLLPMVADPLRRGRILNEAVEAALNRDWLWTALLLQDQVVSESERSGVRDHIDALIWRGMILSRLAENARSFNDFAQAATLLPHLKNENVREKTAADLAFCKAVASPKTIDDASVAAALAFYRRAGNRVRLSELYRLQAFAAVDRGASDEGEALLRRSLGEIRFGQESLHDPASKLIYGASASQVASFVAQKLLQRGDSGRALALLEEIRDARALKASASASKFRVPAGTAAVFYFIGDETSAVWVLRENDIHHVPLCVQRRDLLPQLAAISEHLSLEGLRNSEVKAAVSALYDELIAPVEQLLRGATVVAVVPDDAIANVPFPALFNRRSRRYLIEDYLIVAAPSIAAYGETQRQAVQPVRLPLREALVLVSNPQMNGIAPLPELNREVAAVRGVANTVRVIGRDGRDGREAIAEAFREAPLIHFGGHGEFDAASPADSALVIGGTADGLPVRLSAREIVAQSTAAKLIVLSACDSGRMSRNMPAAGIAQWLVASGVTSVVATISPVDDSAATDLVCDYYRRLKQSSDSAAALRSAQLDALKRGDDLGWPAFIHFGAPRQITERGAKDAEN
jgi:CHAT domain-containing protein